MEPPAYTLIQSTTAGPSGTISATSSIHSHSFTPVPQTPPPTQSASKRLRLVPLTNPPRTRMAYIDLSHIVLVAIVDYFPTPLVFLSTALSAARGQLRLAPPTSIDDILFQAYPGEFVPIYSGNTLQAIVRPEAVVEVLPSVPTGTAIGILAVPHDVEGRGKVRTTLVRLAKVDLQHVVDSLTGLSR
ncbi:hypothetical protein HK097_008466 [Rhizophlyctis rosea]|uniref:Uncharacterized protein n=1 Tax=Rhizophlyctis rosea TaxID=64517 RepID=A0AAD5SN63_9FUNG|nr:hypothetical protein HK097_008466 [Rhizophlyctis rosea]